MKKELDLLKKQLKTGDINHVYVFTGEETYLKDSYLRQFVRVFEKQGMEEFNIIKLDKDSFSAETLLEAVESYPVMAENKLVIVSGTGLFEKASEETKKLVQDILADVPLYLTLIFDELKCDGKLASVKQLKKEAVYVEFSYLRVPDLCKWIEGECKRSGVDISVQTAAYLAERCDSGENSYKKAVSMSRLKTELDKLVIYCHEKQKIMREDIDVMVTASLKERTFDMLDHLFQQDTQGAIAMLEELKELREPVQKILTLLGSHIDSLIRVKTLLDAGYSKQEIAKQTGLREYFLPKYMGQARTYTRKRLIEMYQAVAQADMDIKSGVQQDWAALEMTVLGLVR